MQAMERDFITSFQPFSWSEIKPFESNGMSNNPKSEARTRERILKYFNVLAGQVFRCLRLLAPISSSTSFGLACFLWDPVRSPSPAKQKPLAQVIFSTHRTNAHFRIDGCSI
jgi:hypothetical protein